jgi:hypothetical protein
MLNDIFVYDRIKRCSYSRTNSKKRSFIQDNFNVNNNYCESLRETESAFASRIDTPANYTLAQHITLLLKAIFSAMRYVSAELKETIHL